MSKILEIKNLTVHYETVDGIIRAVENLNLTLDEGMTLGLVGETGAGKTTAMKAIMRILPQPPAKIKGGEVFFKGENVLKKSNKEMLKIRGKQISMVFQDPMTSLNPLLTVGEQIAEVIYLHGGKTKKEAHVAARDMLETVGIKAERSNEYPHQFSGGMKQRVIIAIALACNPRLLIADEPTTALDVTIQAQVIELMKRLKKQYNTAMILITHDLGIVTEICDKVAIMYAGEIVEYGSLVDIFNDAQHPYTKGLFNCIPDIYIDDNELIPIPGLMPDPTKIKIGCSFFPRCSYAKPKCEIKDSEMAEVSPGHFVKCALSGTKMVQGGNNNA
jgi:peptide/nickel transport system ATP-binding protein